MLQNTLKSIHHIFDPIKEQKAGIIALNPNKVCFADIIQSAWSATCFSVVPFFHLLLAFISFQMILVAALGLRKWCQCPVVQHEMKLLDNIVSAMRNRALWTVIDYSL